MSHIGWVYKVGQIFFMYNRYRCIEKITTIDIKEILYDYKSSLLHFFYTICHYINLYWFIRVTSYSNESL